MKKVVITDSLTREEYENLKDLYLRYFNEAISYDEEVQLATQASEKPQVETNIHFWVAKDQETGEIVGFAKGKTYPDGVGLLNHIFIKPEYREENYRIGNAQTSIILALNGTVVDWFLSEGMHTIELETTKTKLGLLGVQPSTSGIHVIDDKDRVILLRKSLEPTNGQNISCQ